MLSRGPLTKPQRTAKYNRRGIRVDDDTYCPIVERKTVPTSPTLEILVADDDPIFRALAVSRLQTVGCRVLEAADGTEAWNIIRAGTIVLAVVDLDMPGFNGLTVMSCLRGHPSLRHIPAVVCTSRQDKVSMNDALMAGATSFFTKPVNWAVLEKHIDHLLVVSGNRSRG
jgi:CheY-like chemotaxis protein